MHAKLPLILLITSLCGVPFAHSAEKPGKAAPAAAATSADANDRRVAVETAAAIEALGANPSTRQISSIVFKAVRSSPASVLHIVNAAVRVSPQISATEIVTAATAGVPNPWKRVTYRRLTANDAKKAAPDFKSSSDGKGVRGPAEPEGTEMTLAEAIARTALDAQPGLSMPALLAAVDVALLTDPAVLIQRISGSRAISGVGDAGTSNYANEPLRPTTVAGTSPVPTPNPPAVSQ